MAENLAFLRDCMDGMREYPDKYFDLAVVDPPYGINITGHNRSQNGHVERERESCRIGSARRGPPHAGGRRREKVYEPKNYPVFQDEKIPDAEYFTELERISRRRIIWGGNFFLDHLGRASCLIVWDKARRGLAQADCEIAWTDLPEQSRIFNFRWNGMLQENEKNREFRIHATQKPVALYAWIFSRWAKPGYRILDTHLGSGSSRIAAWDAGLDFVGFEISPVYFELEEKRFEQHTAQMSLFVDG